MEDLDDLRNKVALSCRILAMMGLVKELTGHVSVRLPDSEEMLIRCRGEDECGLPYTSADAIRRTDFNGNGKELESYELPNEFHIHSEIYKIRPEVGAVVHAHPPAALACSIADIELRPIFNSYDTSAMRLAIDGIPVFPRSMRIADRELALSMIETMGNKKVCLLKGHGITVVGRTVEEATITAIRVEKLAQVALQVAQTGKVASDVNEEDIEVLRPGLPNSPSPHRNSRLWRYYVKMLEDRN
jgi:ribulose-5-phosphate 4-epimerase/fuculose-1-phosphate aldolase